MIETPRSFILINAFSPLFTTNTVKPHAYQKPIKEALKKRNTSLFVKSITRYSRNKSSNEVPQN